MGNVRLSYLKNAVTGDLQVVEEENYYAFGMKHTGYNNAVTGLGNATAQKNEYNGKEFQDELSFNMYDYGARNYDATLGRWMNIDPLAEISRRWSPYTYALDNPVVFIDRDGMKAVYSFQRGAYMEAGENVSFEYAMASNGVNFTPVDPDSGNLVYLATKSAYDALMATGTGGGPGDGGGFWGWLFGNKRTANFSGPSESVSDEEMARMIAEEPDDNFCWSPMGNFGAGMATKEFWRWVFNGTEEIGSGMELVGLAAGVFGHAEVAEGLGVAGLVTGFVGMAGNATMDGMEGKWGISCI